jgi:hypothetical protein
MSFLLTAMATVAGPVPFKPATVVAATNNYLVQEVDGTSRFTLEDASGSVKTEDSA